MTIIDLPMNLIYGVCALGFAAADRALGAGRHRELAPRVQPARAPEHAIEEHDRDERARDRRQGAQRASQRD